MVTCTLAGYLGNQMFRIAATVGYAVKHNLAYHIPKESVNPSVFPQYFPHLVGSEIQHNSLYTYAEPCFEYAEIPFFPHIKLDGLFQSEKYFSHCSKRIRSLFFEVPPLQKGVVAVGVRRGDYLQLASRHPVITKEYIEKQIMRFAWMGYKSFIFFSNGIDWCREHFTGFMGLDIQFDETADPVEKMKKMASCEHFIISNSTFDWWAAWLGAGTEKMVVYPETWFGSDYQIYGAPYKYDGSPTCFNTCDLIPDKWLKSDSLKI